MIKSKLKIFLIFIIISILISSCSHRRDKINDNNFETQSFFVIDYDVNLYTDKDSLDVVKKITFFDQIVVLSDDVADKGRIKVKLQDGLEGWIDVKFTSFIPKSWIKLQLLENYYGYTFTGKKIEFQKKEDDDGKHYYFKNSDFEISMATIYMMDYKQTYESHQDTLKSEIDGGRDKKLNWNKEFIIGNHKVNYVITTDHPDGGICESFEFIKINEMNLKKYYYVTFDYQPYESKEKKLMQRKIMFSVLQSLK